MEYITITIIATLADVILTVSLVLTGLYFVLRDPNKNKDS